MLLFACGSDADQKKIERLEAELKQAHTKQTDLNQQLASCLESRLLMEKNREAPVDAGVPIPKPDPTVRPIEKPKPKPSGPVCNPQLDPDCDEL